MGVVISRAASAVKGRVPLCLCMAAFALTSCGGSGFDEPADPLTPDVTSFGIRPVAQLVDPQGDTYLMRYSRDNRLVSLDVLLALRPDFRYRALPSASSGSWTLSRLNPRPRTSETMLTVRKASGSMSCTLFLRRTSSRGETTVRSI